MVEPVKDYTRWDDSKGPIDFHTPLNHLIDAVYPESETARQFAFSVQTLLQSGYKDKVAEGLIRGWLMTWQNNHVKLRPVLDESFLLQEDGPLSEDLSALGAAALQALDYLDTSQPAPEAWKTQQLTLIDQAKKPKAGLLLMVAAPIQSLVEASAGH